MFDKLIDFEVFWVELEWDKIFVEEKLTKSNSTVWSNPMDRLQNKGQ